MSEYLGKDTFKLGFGLMRLPTNEDGATDISQVCQMVDKFIEAGVLIFKLFPHFSINIYMAVPGLRE
ncbi:hypothetical protein D1841_11630 [Neglecta sp. X4]|uniref:hypothetical protein n=1 Tax=unclassified Neglectibacter TaxID=2632164 RepID=UPI001370F054|nr:hypothetical protein [Neglectibacter sp. 59]NBJ73913.1 hypothetical protein [Neglectibacter sp. X4]NCE81686.1 hypothetical protein [Neglectibacter sp. X58]